MTSLKTAFSLSKEDVKNATPPGTATLVGNISPLFVLLLTYMSSTRAFGVDSVADKS
jgi:hypothetical protein